MSILTTIPKILYSYLGPRTPLTLFVVVEQPAWFASNPEIGFSSLNLKITQKILPGQKAVEHSAAFLNEKQANEHQAADGSFDDKMLLKVEIPYAERKNFSAVASTRFYGKDATQNIPAEWVVSATYRAGFDSVKVAENSLHTPAADGARTVIKGPST